jgi:hypothetical protein
MSVVGDDSQMMVVDVEVALRGTGNGSKNVMEMERMDRRNEEDQEVVDEEGLCLGNCIV